MKAKNDVNSTLSYDPPPEHFIERFHAAGGWEEIIYVGLNDQLNTTLQISNVNVCDPGTFDYIR